MRLGQCAWLLQSVAVLRFFSKSGRTGFFRAWNSSQMIAWLKVGVDELAYEVAWRMGRKPSACLTALGQILTGSSLSGWEHGERPCLGLQQNTFSNEWTPLPRCCLSGQCGETALVFASSDSKNWCNPTCCRVLWNEWLWCCHCEGLFSCYMLLLLRPLCLFQICRFPVLYVNRLDR